MMNLFLTKMQLSLHKTLIDGLEWCGFLVDYCDFYQLFGLSFWRHPFTAQDPLMSKWWNAKFLQICSDEETKSKCVSKYSANVRFLGELFLWNIPIFEVKKS